jgi:hypothetical protein
LTGNLASSFGPKHVRWFVVLVAAVALVFFGNEAYLKYLNSGGRVVATDYEIYRFASVLLWQGDLVTLFDPGKFFPAHDAFAGTPLGFSPFPYPPSALWVVAPLDLLPDFVRPLLWLGVPFAAFAWIVCRNLDRPWPAAPALLLAPASIMNIAEGQNGFLSAALLCGGLLALPARPLLAGALIGLLSYKPQLGILLPFVLLAGGYYRAFVMAVAVTIALVLASLALFGVEPWRIYLNAALPTQRAFLETGGGFALLTTPSVFMGGRLLGLPIALDYVLQGIATLLVIGACTWIFSRRAIQPAQKLPLVMVGAFLATPYCAGYDLGIVAAAQLLALHRSPGRYQLHAVAWVLPLLMIPLSIVHVPVGPIVLSVLFYVLWSNAWRTREQPA